MNLLIISKNNENFKSAHKLLNVHENEILYGREARDAELYCGRKFLDGVIFDLPYPTNEEMDFCVNYKSKTPKTKIMILVLEISQNMKASLIKSGCDVFVVDPPSVYIEKLSTFSELIGTSKEMKHEKIIIDNGIIFDVKGWKIIKNGKSISLPEKEYRLFSLFAENKERIFTTEELLNNVWDERTEKERVRQYISKIRKKIGDDGKNPKLLIHENGAGYYLKTNKS